MAKLQQIHFYRHPRVQKTVSLTSNQIRTRPSKPISNSPSKFSTFTNCVKTGNATAARLFKKSSRGYPQIHPCNAHR